MKKRHALGILSAVLLAVVLLPFVGKPAYADDPVIINSLDGTSTPTVRVIAVSNEFPKTPVIELDSTDPVYETGGASLNLNAIWYRKNSDGEWVTMPSDLPFSEGSYRYHVCVMCPNENYTFADDAILNIDDETWSLVAKGAADDGREYALFASPEINLPGTQLSAPESFGRVDPSSIYETKIKWNAVEHAKGYVIHVTNTRQGYSQLDTTITVNGGSTTTYDLRDAFKETTIRTGYNSFVVEIKALAQNGYLDSEYTSSPAGSSQWGFQITKSLHVTIDASTGQTTWDTYDYPQTKYYHYWITANTSDGKQLIDGYKYPDDTKLNLEAYIAAYNWEYTTYCVHVVAMDERLSEGGWVLTEDSYDYYDYTPKIRAISINGVTPPREGELAEAYIGNYSVEEDHVYLPEPGSGSAYWRRHASGSWVTTETGEKFKASGEYRLSIPIHWEEGYTLANDVAVKVNDKTVAAEVDIINETTARLECPMDVIISNGNTYVVTAGALNVRADADGSSDRVGGVSYGDVIQAQGQCGIWIEAEYEEGETGWVNVNYLALAPSGSEDQPGAPFEDGPVKYKVTAGEMNVRSAPEIPEDTTANRIGGISNNKEVLATGAFTDDTGRVWITMDYYDSSYPDKGHRLGYVLFSRPNSASSSGTTYYFNGDSTPPTKTPGKEDTDSDELVVSTGSYPKVTLVPYKATVAVGDIEGHSNTADLDEENFENKGDGYLTTTIYPDDAMNFSTLAADHITLGSALAEMEVAELTLNADGSITLRLGLKNPVTYTFSEGGNGTWTKSSTEGFGFIVNRSADDDTTFSLFESISIDGTVIDAENYDAESGSLVGSLKAAFLETLSAGEHTMTVAFRDGSAETTLTVAAAAEEPDDFGDDSESDNSTDKTPSNSGSNSDGSQGTITAAGDSAPIGIPIILAAVSLVLLAGLLIYHRRTEE